MGHHSSILFCLNHGSNRLFLACELFNGEGDVSYSYDLNQAFAHSGSRLMAHAKRIVMWCLSISVELTLKPWQSLPKIKAYFLCKYWKLVFMGDDNLLS